MRILLPLALILFSSSLLATTRPIDTYHSQIASYCQLRSHCEEVESPSSSVLEKLKLAEVSAVLACKSYFEANHCQEVKDLIGVQKSNMVISCDPKKLCEGFLELDRARCMIDGAKDHFSIINVAMLLGYAIGGKASIAASTAMLPLLIYGAGAAAEQCNKDINYKIMAVKLHNLSLLEDERPLDVEGRDKSLLSMECADLTGFLQNRQRVFSERRTSDQQWSVDVKKVKPSPEKEAMLRLLRSQSCYRPTVIKENICKELTSLALGGITAPVAGKIAKVSLGIKEFKLNPMLEKYNGEQLKKKAVYYYTPAEKSKLQISVDRDGRILNSNGKPLTLTYGLYVMDEFGNIFVTASPKGGKIHHSSFLSGAPVAAAGHMTVVNGVLSYIDRSSGHYAPTPAQLKQVVNELKSKGVNFKNVEVSTEY